MTNPNSLPNRLSGSLDHALGRHVSRSASDRWISGVLGGLAATLNVDASLVRIGAVILAFVSFWIIVPLYLLLWWILPAE